MLPYSQSYDNQSFMIDYLNFVVGGYCQRGVAPLVFIPPFDTINLLIMGRIADQKQKMTEAYNQGVPDDLKGTEYEALWNANPWKDMYYSSIQKGKMYDTNAHYLEEFNKYVAGIYDQKRQDEYNSPSEQAERMRLAGQNPDLLGTSGVSQTDEMNPPSSNPTPTLNGSSPLNDIFGMMTTVLQDATSLYSSIMQGKVITYDSLLMDKELSDSFRSDARKDIASTFSAFYADGSSFPNDYDWLNDMKASSSNYSNKRQRKHYERAFIQELNSGWFSIQKDAFEELDLEKRARKHFMGGYVDMALDALKSSYSADKSKSEYEVSSYNLGSAIAKDRKRMFDTLYKDYKSGSAFAGALILAQAQQLARIEGNGPDLAEGFMNMFPNISLGRSWTSKK